MPSQFFGEETIRYRTYIKQTLTEGLTAMFAGHPDPLIQGTKAVIEYPRTEADYPCVVVKFYERQIFNSGVAHEEVAFIEGESDSVELTVQIGETDGAVSLVWAPNPNASGFNVYRGTESDQENQQFQFSANVTEFTDVGNQGNDVAVPTIVTAKLDTPEPTATILPRAYGSLAPGTYYYRVTATSPSQAIKFKHYYYTGDIEFSVYALTSLDRDLIADSIVQTITMGQLQDYTNNFFERVYTTTQQVPDSALHFINVNADQLQGFGDTESQTPWGAEDDLIYQTSYRTGVFGELYSLPPTLSYALIRQVFLYPYITSLQADPDIPQSPAV